MVGPPCGRQQDFGLYLDMRQHWRALNGFRIKVPLPKFFIRAIIWARVARGRGRSRAATQVLVPLVAIVASRFRIARWWGRREAAGLVCQNGGKVNPHEGPTPRENVPSDQYQLDEGQLFPGLSEM